MESHNIDQKSYLQFFFSYQQIQKLETRTEEQLKFIDTFQALNTSLGIEMAWAQVFEPMQAETIEKKAVLRSTSLEDAADSWNITKNPDVSTFVENQISTSKSMDNIKFSLSKLSDLPKYEIKKFKEQNPLFKDSITDNWKIDTRKLTDTQKTDLETKIASFLEEYERKKKEDMIKSIHEWVMRNCFKWLVSYFDINSINQENFSKDIKINMNDDITIKNSKLYIRWSVKWKNIWMYYNMDNWEIEMDDFLAKSNGEFFIWAAHGKTEKLKIKLPTYNELVEKWEKINYSGILEKSKNEQDFTNWLNKTIDEEMSNSFWNNYVNKYFIWKHVEEYIAEQEILDNIFQNRFAWTNYSPNNDFRKNDLKITRGNENQYNFISMIYNTLEEQNTPNSIVRLRKAINDLNTLTEKAKDKTEDNRTKCPIFNELFGLEKTKKWKDDWINNKKTNYQTFFNFFTKWWDSHPKIDIILFEKINKTLKNWGSLEKIDDPIVGERIEEHISPDLDANLEQQLEEIFPDDNSNLT